MTTEFPAIHSSKIVSFFHGALELIHMSMALCRGGSRAAAASKMERFVIIVNGFQPLAIITKHSILDVAASLDLPLLCLFHDTCCKHPL